MQKIRFFTKNERGVIIVIIALVLPILLVLCGLALDFAFLYYQRNRLQDVADAAALAGEAQRVATKESRFFGSQASDDLDNLHVGKTILAFVKANDAGFNSIELSEFKYKGNYSLSGGVVESLMFDDSNNRFVKLESLECWLDSSKGPLFDDKLKVKIEYAISGRLNEANFFYVKDDGSEDDIDDRVRVRLTKRIHLLFLSTILNEKYKNGVPLTVISAAQKPQVRSASIVSISNEELSFSGLKLSAASNFTNIKTDSSYTFNIFCSNGLDDLNSYMFLTENGSKLNVYLPNLSYNFNYSNKTTVNLMEQNALKVSTSDFTTEFINKIKEASGNPEFNVDNMTVGSIFSCRHTEEFGSIFQTAMLKKYPSRHENDIFVISCVDDVMGANIAREYQQELWRVNDGLLEYIGSVYNFTGLNTILNKGIKTEEYLFYENAIEELAKQNSSKDTALTKFDAAKSVYESFKLSDRSSNRRYIEFVNDAIKTNIVPEDASIAGGIDLYIKGNFNGGFAQFTGMLESTDTEPFKGVKIINNLYVESDSALNLKTQNMVYNNIYYGGNNGITLMGDKNTYRGLIYSKGGQIHIEENSEFLKGFSFLCPGEVFIDLKSDGSLYGNKVSKYNGSGEGGLVSSGAIRLVE